MSEQRSWNKAGDKVQSRCTLIHPEGSEKYYKLEACQTCVHTRKFHHFALWRPYISWDLWHLEFYRKFWYQLSWVLPTRIVSTYSIGSLPTIVKFHTSECLLNLCARIEPCLASLNRKWILRGGAGTDEIITIKLTINGWKPGCSDEWWLPCELGDQEGPTRGPLLSDRKQTETRILRLSGLNETWPTPILRGIRHVLLEDICNSCNSFWKRKYQSIREGGVTRIHSSERVTLCCVEKLLNFSLFVYWQIIFMRSRIKWTYIDKVLTHLSSQEDWCSVGKVLRCSYVEQTLTACWTYLLNVGYHGR